MATTDTIREFIPTISTGGIGTVILFFVVVVALILISGLVTYFLVMFLVYNKRLVIFEKINGRIEVVARPKAREMKIGEGGDTAFYVQKIKKVIPTPSIQTGRRTYWFYRREDGELINIGIQDIDEQMRSVKAHFLDKEMRYSRTALQRNLGIRYDKVKFWDKYGGIILFTIYIAIVGIMVYLVFDKFIELAGQVAGIVNNADQVVQASKDLLIALDNVQSGTGGIIPA